MERELGKPKCSEDESKFIMPECNTLLHTVFIKSENVCENVEIYENATQGEHMRTWAAVETSGQNERRGCVMMEMFQDNFWKP